MHIAGESHLVGSRRSTLTPAVAMSLPNAQMQAVLTELANLGGKPIETLSATDARLQPTPTDAVVALLAKRGKPTTPDASVSTVDRMIPGPGGPMSARIYTPVGTAQMWPVVVYYHGGGWVIANKEVYDGGARALSRLANVMVISVDYRSGPEHPFPAAHDDALAAYTWVIGNAAALHADPARVALAGESAGGNLAIATAIAARDQKLPSPLAIISVYPVASNDTNSVSYVEQAQAKPLNRAMMLWFFKHALASPADLADPRINLVGAHLSGLAPTTIINAELDPLRRDGELLAEKMRDAGVAVEQRTYPGVTHEFFGMGAVVDEALAAEQFAANALRHALRPEAVAASVP
jgi:acetyl esterase/lipase